MNNITGTLFQSQRIFFPRKKYVRLNNLKTEGLRKSLHFDFRCISHHFEIFLTEVQNTSGLKNQLAVQRSAFSNARKYPHLKKRLIIEFFVFDKIEILVSYLRWVIIVLSQKNSSKYHFAPLKFLNFIFKSKIMKTINSANGRNFPLN